MLKGPRLKTVSYRTLGFPEYGMANASNFMRGFTPASNPKRGNNILATKLAFIYVKRAKAKNSVISYLRVPRVRNNQCKQFHARLYPCQQPQKGNVKPVETTAVLLPLLGLLSGVKPRLKLLALSISYSWNPNEQFDNVFILGPFNINKLSFWGTSKGDFGVKAPPQPCQQSIFGMSMATQINPRGQTFWPS